MAGMVVQHNLNAINANNKMNINVSGTKKATEKLSSGYQINRAGDNAAGLAISEKMRSQIRGLSQATKNANDGISLIQTAEGGLNETHSILQRMRELAVQSANGTYQDDTDREAIQLEVDALKSEIDRIASSTEYNGMKLLDGSLGGTTTGTTDFGARYGVLISANTVIDGANKLKENLSLEGATLTSSVNGVTVTLADAASGVGGENAQWNAAGTTLTINLKAGQSYSQSQINDLIKNATMAKANAAGTPQASTPADVELKLKSGVFTFQKAETFKTSAGVRAASDDTDLVGYLINGTDQNDGYADTIKFTSNNYGEDTRKLRIATDVAAGKEWVATTTANNEGTGIKDGEFTLHLATGVEYTEEDIQNLLKQAGLDYTVTLTDSKTPDGDKTFYAQKVVAEADATAIEIGKKTTAGAGLGSDKLTGTGKGLTFQIGANGVEDQRVTLSVGDMSSTSIGVGGADVSTQDAANKAIDMVDAAVKTVSMQRAGLGALQNRLEYTVNNLTTTNENLTAAESQIRDTDMATEMINYTKNNILQQASQAMLAQANQQPQAILQLLQ